MMYFCTHNGAFRPKTADMRILEGLPYGWQNIPDVILKLTFCKKFNFLFKFFGGFCATFS